jgi:hypothetical protein
MIKKINSNNKFMFVINNPKGCTEKNTDLSQITGKLYNIMLYRLGEIRNYNVIGDR